MKRFIFLLVLLLPLSFVRANYYVEPYIGHDLVGSADYKISSGQTFDFKFKALHIGARFGWTFWESLTLGADYAQSRFAFEGNGAHEKMHGKIWGPFVMYRFSQWVKIWYTYMFYSRFEYEEGTSVDDKLIGEGHAFGISYIDIPYIDFNLEYRIHTLGSFYNDDIEQTNPLNYPYNASQILLSLSAPINF